MTKLVYLDYNATTPVAPEVLDAMLPWMSDQFWNAASAHAGGRFAQRAIDVARTQVAALIGASAQEIIWTSGATEANNLALKGIASSAAPGSRILVASTEHKAVLDTAYALETSGIKVEELAVDNDGLVDIDAVGAQMAEDVFLMSVMYANNETGVLQPIEQLARLAHDSGALLHTDATQAVGRIPVDVNALGVDLASVSAHKFHGPKGVGCLFVRRGTNLEPQMHGGGHESGLRSGTSNVPGIVGFGQAAVVAKRQLNTDQARARVLVDRLVAGLRAALTGVEVVSKGASRLPNTVNIRFVGADGEAVMVNASSILISSGSACTSSIPDASHVLQAMGMSQDEAYECLRFSVGRQTTEQEIDVAVDEIAGAVIRVRQLTRLGDLG